MALVNHKIKSKYNYYPKTTNELVKYIKTELDNGNTNLNCIDTSEITDMSNLFDQDDGIKLTKEQQETLDVSNWNVSNVKNMRFMFEKCEQINCDISNWNVSEVQNMAYMFFGCKHFNEDISNWNVSNVIRFQYMFYGCECFKSDLSKWNVSNIKSIYNHMFTNSGLNGHEPSWYKK